MTRQIQFTRVVTQEISDAEYELIAAMSDNKVRAIKFLRGQHSLGLKEAKDICDAIWGLPYTPATVVML
jgi:ribosomal protein L7/L12